MMSNMMRYWELVGTGGLPDLHLRTAPMPDPGPGEVRIRVTSIGVNRAELMATVGHYPLKPPAVLGMEAGGVIDALGPELTGAGVIGAPPGGWHVGHRVTPANGTFQETGRGAYATHLIVAEKELIASPSNVDDAHIGALWLPYVTCEEGLLHKGEIRPGQRVLIPAASSSTGLAAIQVCRAEGATPVPSTTRGSKVDAIASIAQIDPASIIVTERESLKDGLRRTLGDKWRPDVVFDCIGGDFLEEAMDAISHGGTIVVYGNLAGKGTILAGRIVMKELRILGEYLGSLRRAPDRMKATYRRIVERLERGIYKLPVAQRFPFDQARAALETMKKNEHVGKLVIVP